MPRKKTAVNEKVVQPIEEPQSPVLPSEKKIKPKANTTEAQFFEKHPDIDPAGGRNADQQPGYSGEQPKQQSWVWLETNDIKPPDMMPCQDVATLTTGKPDPVGPGGEPLAGLGVTLGPFPNFNKVAQDISRALTGLGAVMGEGVKTGIDPDAKPDPLTSILIELQEYAELRGKGYGGLIGLNGQIAFLTVELAQLRAQLKAFDHTDDYCTELEKERVKSRLLAILYYAVHAMIDLGFDNLDGSM